jgi:hypothetical protein
MTTFQAPRRRGRPRKVTTNTDSLPSQDEREVDVLSGVDSETDLPSVDSFNPLGDAVTERDYSSPKIAEGVTEDLEEPVFHTPTYQELNGESAQAKKEEETLYNPLETGNPALEDLPEREKRAAVETMVEAVLDLYDGAHIIAQKAAQVPEEKLYEMHRNGEINLNQRIPIGPSEDANVVELTQAYNSQAVEALTPNPEFRDKVRPPMTRIFMKRGWGMTDEQALLLHFGQDIITKGILVYQLRAQMNQILKLVAIEKSERQESQAEPEPVYEPEVDHSAVAMDIEEVADDTGLTTNLAITVEDNPLRDTRRRKPGAPRVKRSYVRGKKLGKNGPTS